MDGKQIVDLESANAIAEGDLLPFRKSSSGTDKKINYTDLVESIGNPAIEGFVATPHPDEPNTIILTPSNNARVSRYYVGMKISFVSPITTTGEVKLQIGNLDPIDFLQYQSTISSIFQMNDYVEGVFIYDKFYRVNDLRAVQNIYSSEYKIISFEIAPDESYTNIRLVSAIGLTKTSYYDGMDISFRCTGQTKGVVNIYVDALEKRFLLDGGILDEDLTILNLTLYINQPVHAIYSEASGTFIRDNYVVNNPDIKPITTEIVPPENIEYFVMNNGNKELKLPKVIRTFLDKDQKGYKVYITIDRVLGREDACVLDNYSLSFIRLSASTNIIKVDLFDKPLFTLTNCSSLFEFAAGLTFDITTNSTYYKFIDIESNFNIYKLSNINFISDKIDNFKLAEIFIKSPNLELHYISATNIAFHPYTSASLGSNYMYNCVFRNSALQSHVEKTIIENCDIQTRENFFAAGVSRTAHCTIINSKLGATNKVFTGYFSGNTLLENCDIPSVGSYSFYANVIIKNCNFGDITQSTVFYWRGYNSSTLQIEGCNFDFKNLYNTLICCYFGNIKLINCNVINWKRFVIYAPFNLGTDADNIAILGCNFGDGTGENDSLRAIEISSGRALPLNITQTQSRCGVYDNVPNSPSSFPMNTTQGLVEYKVYDNQQTVCTPIVEPIPPEQPNP